MWPAVPTRTVAGVGTAACVLIAVVAAADVVVRVILPVISYWLARRAMEELDVSLLNAAGLLNLFAGLLLAPLGIAAIVVLLVWMWRAHKNLFAFPGVTPRLGAGWSIGGWFIPFANLVMPAMAMNEIARGSLPGKGRDPMRTGTHPLVRFWWAAWLVSVCTAGVALVIDRLEARDLKRVLTNRDDFQSFIDYYVGLVARNMIGTAAFVAAAVLVIILVRRISRAQTDRIARAYQLGRVAYAPGMPAPGPATPPAPATTPGPAPAPDPAPAPGATAAHGAPAPDQPAAPGPGAPPVGPGTPA